MRQHLIVAQTINSVCQSWPGAPKVVATSDGWLVSGPTGATAAVPTVEAVWSAILRSSPGLRSSDLHNVADGPGAAENADAAGNIGDLEARVLAAGDPQAELALRVLNLGQHMARNVGTVLGSLSLTFTGTALDGSTSNVVTVYMDQGIAPP